jgi:hypothetical protein
MNRSVWRENQLAFRPAVGTGYFDRSASTFLVQSALTLALERRFDWVATPRTSKFQAKQKT